MMPVRRAWPVLVACVCAVAGLAGCSPATSNGGCCAARAPARPAYALDVTTAGRVRWQVPLGPPETGLQVSPVAVGAVAVFAHGGVSPQAGDVLYGLRLADGHRLWSRAFRPGHCGHVAVASPGRRAHRWQRATAAVGAHRSGGVHRAGPLDTPGRLRRGSARCARCARCCARRRGAVRRRRR